MRWIAFYRDHQVTSAESSWAALPRDGLLIAVWWDEQGQRHLDCGADTLVHTGSEIVSVNLPTQAFERAGAAEARAGRLKYGLRLEPEEWAALRALADRAHTPPER